MRREPKAPGDEPGAYRGYLIRRNPLTGAWWVEKDGVLICHVANGWAAVCAIDELVTP